jgi:hypothetical protein
MSPARSSPIILICRIIGHRRSKSRAYFVPELGLWRSFCRRCGTPLLREKDGRWHTHEWEASSAAGS